MTNRYLDKKIVISPDVLVQNMANQAVLLDLESEHYFGLDEVGMDIWQGLEAGMTTEAIRAKLLAEYDVEEQRLDGDMEAFVGSLEERGLVTITDQ